MFDIYNKTSIPYPEAIVKWNCEKNENKTDVIVQLMLYIY